jgi:hypothetical protein
MNPVNFRIELIFSALLAGKSSDFLPLRNSRTAQSQQK